MRRHDAPDRRAPRSREDHPAKELAAANRALRLTPDHWMIPLFGEPMADGKRFVLEGRLISIALQALRLGTSVVLDYGLWGRDERWALRWLARSAGASCQVVYLPVDKGVQLARIAHRQATAPHQTFPMSEADVDQWREHPPDRVGRNVMRGPSISPEAREKKQESSNGEQHGADLEPDHRGPGAGKGGQRSQADQQC